MQAARETCGVVLSPGFDPFNPDWEAVPADRRDCVKASLGDYLHTFLRDSVVEARHLSRLRLEIAFRHYDFADFVLENAATEPPGLAWQMQQGRERIRNVAEGDSLFTLGPYDVLGHTLRYDLTLQEEENIRQTVVHAGLIVKLAITVLVVIGTVIAVLWFAGVISSGGLLAGATAPVIGQIVGVLGSIGQYLLLSTAALAILMFVTVPLLAPHVVQYHNETLDAAEALIRGYGSAHLLDCQATAEPGHVRLNARVAGPDAGQSRVLVETALCSVDGRIMELVWSPVQVNAGQSAVLSKDVPLRPGSYKAVTTLYADGDKVEAQVRMFDVAGPELQLQLSLAQSQLSPGEPLQAQVMVTNTDPGRQVSDLTLIAQSTDGVHFYAWPVSLEPNGTRQIDYTFVPTSSGACVLRAWLGIGLSALAQQDAGYIVGSGPAVAINTSLSEMYPPGVTVTLPLTLSNAGTAPGAAALTVRTVDRLRSRLAVYTWTATTTIAAGGEALATAIAYPNAQPGLYSANLDLNGRAYDVRDFAVGAEDTLFGLLTVSNMSPSLGQSVPVTATVRGTDGALRDATLSVTVQPPGGASTVLPMTWVSAGTYRGNYRVSAGGTHGLELSVVRPNYRGVGDRAFLVCGNPTWLIPTVEGQPKVREIRPLTITLRSEVGLPVMGASVVLSGTHEMLHGETDAQGRVVLQAFPPDIQPYVLTAEKMGYASATTQVVVEPFKVCLPVIVRRR